MRSRGREKRRSGSLLTKRGKGTKITAVTVAIVLTARGEA